ncbi:MAG: tRNA 2-thiouridine(34) synthase MnmA [Calditrichaceae bacterium]|jgi:tRNA-uridine 2-sulfurtransferase
MPDKNKTVVVAMSGGVDSSVAALLLKEKGYNCIGITMKLWDYDRVGGNLNHDSGCCSLDSINDARLVCAKIGIPHYVLNFSSDFHDGVVDDFITEYMSGRTPNPCIQCNIKIKWQTLIEKSKELGADFIATGHYARVVYDKSNGRYALYRGNDENKDQSYALWGIKQENLKRTLFPLGELSKPEVRKIAEKHGLRTAHKSESMEICFIPDNNYNRFLKQVVPGLDNKIADGNLVNTRGEKLGKHSGYPFFTIGQRRGIGKGFGKPMYVIGTDPKKNFVIIGEENELYAKELIARKVNFVSIAGTNGGIRGRVKIRYRDKGSMATIHGLDEERVRIVFDEPQKAITPGQSAVFYDDDRVLGGGIIDSFTKYTPKNK